MEKRNMAKIGTILLYTVVLTSLLLGVTTLSFAAKKAASGIVDINTADEKTLASLPGVGKATAKAIVAGRPYKSVDELKRVKGMSDKKIEALKGMVTTSGAAASGAAATASNKVATAEKSASNTATSASKQVSDTEKAASTKASKASKKLAPGERVNINTASKEALEALPGIGPAKAQLIIDGRPYNQPEDLMKVKGIKQKTFDKLKDFVTVR